MLSILLSAKLDKYARIRYVQQQVQCDHLKIGFQLLNYMINERIVFVVIQRCLTFMGRGLLISTPIDEATCSALFHTLSQHLSCLAFRIQFFAKATPL